jgi:hypothetical protein
MGWLKYMLLGDLGQQLDINEQRAEMDSLRDELRRARAYAPSSQPQGDTRRLREEIDELRLYVAALTRLLISNNVVDKAELERVVNEIDASDGESDGKYDGEIA